MKLNINVLIGCALCVVLIGVFGALNRTADSRDDWRPSEAYSRVGGSAYSAVSYSAASSSADGLSVPAVSMRGGNSMFRRRTVSSYAPVYSAPTSLIASSPYRLGASASNSAASALYTTSSATAKSFGSGNALSGVSMSGGVVRATNSQSPVSNSQLSIANIQSPIAYTQLPTTEVQSPIAANDQGIGNTTIGGPRGMRGRQNGGPATNTGGWLNWLVLNGYGTQGADGIWGLDVYELRRAYDAYVDAWNPTMGGNNQPPTWDEWLSWFMGSEDSPYGWTGDGGDSYSYYKFVPIGDVMPFLLLALLYTIALIIRRRKLGMGCRSLE